MMRIRIPVRSFEPALTNQQSGFYNPSRSKGLQGLPVGDVSMGSVLCEHCTAACCRYLALPLDPPTCARDYDDMRWYLLHQGVSIFVEEGDWYVQFQTVCRELAPDNRCGIYETRPAICREYKAKNCDYNARPYGYDHLFTHAEQMQDYYEKKTGKKLGVPREPDPKRRRKKKTA